MLDKITKLKRNRTFDYSPRYYKNDTGGSPFKLEHKFDKFRTTVDAPRGLKNKLGNAMADARRKGDRNLKIRFLIILGILLFIFLFIIDFDLSIFLPQ
ncbi:riboflavin synthase subunit beta [Aggregatimonas sangjinii]|nr:riboflavin synthase subunit beta [Aggregatimonas sangjinii]